MTQTTTGSESDIKLLGDFLACVKHPNTNWDAWNFDELIEAFMRLVDTAASTR